MLLLEILLVALNIAFICSVIILCRAIFLGRFKQEVLVADPEKSFSGRAAFVLLGSFICIYLLGIIYITIYLDFYISFIVFDSMYFWILVLLSLVATAVITLFFRYGDANAIFIVPTIVFVFGFWVQMNIQASNSFFGGNHQKFTVNGKILTLSRDDNNCIYRLKMMDSNSNKRYTFDLTLKDSKKNYKVGGFYQKDLRIGNWGYLYSYEQ